MSDAMPRRLAILIGNGSFGPESELEVLRGPGNDVRELAAILADPERGNFEVSTFVDQKRSDVLPAIQDVVGAATPDDLVLIFYGGHGKLDGGGRLCLAMAETHGRRVRSTSLSASELTAVLGEGRAGAVVLMLDCCYSGAIGREFLRGSANDEIGMLTREVSGLYVVTASTGTQTARERENDAGGVVMGAFTRQIVEGMRSGAADCNADGSVTFSDLVGYLQATVRGQKPLHMAHEAHGDPLLAHAAPPSTPAQRRLERLGQWLESDRLTIDDYNDLVAALEGASDDKLRTRLEQLLDDKRTVANSLVGVLRAARQPKAAPKAAPKTAEVPKPPPPAPEKTEEKRQEETAAPAPVHPPLGTRFVRYFLEGLHPYVQGTLSGALIAGLVGAGAVAGSGPIAESLAIIVISLLGAVMSNGLSKLLVGYNARTSLLATFAMITNGAFLLALFLFFGTRYSSRADNIFATWLAVSAVISAIAGLWSRSHKRGRGAS
jgi:hypothetical protein